MSGLIKLVAFSFLIAGIAGCQLQLPRLFHPGDLRSQTTGALLHDPYPDNHAGPEAVGVRPPDWQEPIPDPRRSQEISDALAPFARRN